MIHAVLRCCRGMMVTAAALIPVYSFAQPGTTRCISETVPVRLVVPAGPGGPTDVLARSMEAVIVDNRPGAFGMIGAELVAKSPPDGRTLLLGNMSTSAVAPVLFPDSRYDSLRDFSPVSLVAQQPLALVVHPSLPARTVKEFIALARARPGEIHLAAPGIGTAQDLAGALLSTMTSSRFSRVAFKGASEIMPELHSGRVQATFTPIQPAHFLLKAGQLRGIATTGTKRAIALPELPTVSEAGVAGYEVTLWYGLLAPSKTPLALIDCFSKSTVQFVGKSEVKHRLENQGFELVANTPDQFRSFIGAELSKWARVIKAENIRAN